MRLILCVLATLALVGSALAGGFDLEISKALRNATPQLSSKSELSRVVRDPSNTRLPEIGAVLDTPQTVPIDAFPWVTALVTKAESPKESYYCAGTIVGRNWILTAAVCADSSVQQRPIRYAIVGASSLSQAHAAVEIDKVILHPSYNPTRHENDLALLRVSSEGISLSLDGPPLTAQVGAIGRVLGWGTTNSTNTPTDLLQLIPTQILDPAVCGGAANYPDQIKPGNFCARSLLKNHDACLGFAGAPLVLYGNAGRQYLAGIVSWGEGCPPKSQKPTVYTDIQNYRDWILDTIRGN
jgi:V8-like Glu-specific endopeptidase